MRYLMTVLAAVMTLLPLAPVASGQGLVIPRRQEQPPGPPLSPQESLEKMRVPEGFAIEVVAAEPQIVNPVAMCIDAQGRFWVTESFEYPRRAAGPGRDRIKVLEDTDQDGRVDRVTVFADGLNIPSGIAVGHGGVWVANAPDLLFLQDTDGDLKADVTRRVLTGFGRTDTHELPSALTWGPDGWLYGLNGVFNRSHVRYPESNPHYAADHPGWPFTCALWRLHPETLEFQIFAEGTSNPWGIAINAVGDFFLSACVIDHLWHITETGYYIRQGGPYPPHTWPMESIVEHKHQKAAYCGIVYFDSPAFPAAYRDTLYMGNVHAGCLNADVLQRRGASYFAKPRPDLITANDVWSMPVAQQIGPDGALYVLDWYDRYHCYQDANADPQGVDRSKGRLYRVRYRQAAETAPVDWQQASEQELIAGLQDANVFVRQQCQRILAERGAASALQPLDQLTHDASLATKFRLHALWASETIRASLARRSEGSRSRDFENLLRCLADADADIRRWAVRLWGDAAEEPWTAAQITDWIEGEADARVLLQWVIAVPKHRFDPAQQTRWTVQAVQQQGTDKTLRQIAWNAIRSLSEGAPTPVAAGLIEGLQAEANREALGAIGVRLFDRLCDHREPPRDALAALARRLLDPANDREIQQRILETLADRSRQGAFSEAAQEQLSAALQTRLQALASASEKTSRLAAAAQVVRALWGDPHAQASLADVARDPQRPVQVRLQALETVVFAHSDRLLRLVDELLTRSGDNAAFVEGVIDRLGASRDAKIAEVLLVRFATMPDALQPKVIELLTQRASWSRALLEQIEQGTIDRYRLNLNQLRRLAGFPDPQLEQQVASIYGTIRAGRGRDRAETVQRIGKQLAGASGNPFHGEKVFKTVCAQCHKIYGEGAEVGPEITRNGRNDWQQLLNNVFDPSAVIGPGYQARTVVTDDGRVLTGLPVEETEQRIVLRVQGGKTETIPRDQIELYRRNDVSMMPDELEKQLSDQELADLFAFLALDKHPRDPQGKLLSGAPAQAIEPGAVDPGAVDPGAIDQAKGQAGRE